MACFLKLPKVKKVSVEGLRSGLQREYLTLQNMEFLKISFYWVLSAFLDPDPDPRTIKSVHNPDPVLENYSKVQDDIRHVRVALFVNKLIYLTSHLYDIVLL